MEQVHKANLQTFSKILGMDLFINLLVFGYNESYTKLTLLNYENILKLILKKICIICPSFIVGHLVLKYSCIFTLTD